MKWTNQIDFTISKKNELRFCFFVCVQNLKFKSSLRDIGDQSVWKNECKKYLSLGRNAIVVIFGTVLAYVLNVYGRNPFTLTGEYKIWNQNWTHI